MLNKIYDIERNTLYIYCEVPEYINIIKKRMTMFVESSTKKSNNYIKIYSDKTIYKINNYECTIQGKIIQTDLYPLFFNVISRIVNDEYNMLLHSAVLCYNNIGILLVGDFGGGKTTLCAEAIKHDMKILSTDQTILSFENDILEFKHGSKYMKVCNNDDFIINNIDNNIKIKLIVNLIGLCDNGTLLFKLIDNKYHTTKILFKHLTWHSDIPLFTDDSILFIDRIKIKKWLNKINIPLYNIRGDIKEIIRRIKEIII